MKKQYSLLFFIGLFLAISLYSCNDDEEDIEPYVDPRDKFVGSWLCTEDNKKSTMIAYTVVISLDASNSSQVLLANFNLFGENESASGLVTNNLITVPLQTILDNDINGKGNMIDVNTINWEYYVDDGADIDTITAVFTKQ